MSKYRKKYSSKEAKDTIEILKISIQNYQEELMFWHTPLILALVWKTEEQCRKEANNEIARIMEKIEYISQFLWK